MPGSAPRLSPTRRRLAWACVLACLIICPSQTGCVRRRMTIRTHPPGARVYVDDYEIGTTPCSANFTYYGTRKIRLVKPGYETLTVMEPIGPPWYQIPPLDFVSENLWPGELQDRRALSYQLVPQRVVPTEELLGRAEALRSQAQLSGMVRSSPATPAGPGPFGPGAGPYPAPPSSGGFSVHELPPGRP